MQFLLNDRQLYREIARKLGVDTNTVIKYEKFIDTKSSSRKEFHKGNDLVNENRSEWMLLQKDYPNLTKTQLRRKSRRKSPVVYAFLFKNDRNWLNVNSPKRQKVETINNRVNWLKRDPEVLKKVHEVVVGVNNISGKPIRITVKSLGDRIEERALLENHLDKL
ncbi:hypothetical protein AU387_00160 [Bacillus halotolerans]|nr:hypothetical protein AU387_00160 [Bacillus halotolerans]